MSIDNPTPGKDQEVRIEYFKELAHSMHSEAERRLDAPLAEDRNLQIVIDRDGFQAVRSILSETLRERLGASPDLTEEMNRHKKVSQRNEVREKFMIETCGQEFVDSVGRLDNADEVMPLVSLVLQVEQIAQHKGEEDAYSFFNRIMDSKIRAYIYDSRGEKSMHPGSLIRAREEDIVTSLDLLFNL